MRSHISSFLRALCAAGLIAAHCPAHAQTTLNGNVVLGNTTVASTATLTLLNGGGYTGNTTIAGGVYLGSDLSLPGNATWTLNGSGSRVDYTNGIQRTLTLPGTATLNRTGSGYSYLYDHLVNAGTVLVDGGTLYGYGNVTNQGTFTVTNGATYAQNSPYVFLNAAGATASVSGTGSVLKLFNVTNTGNLYASGNGTLQLAGTAKTANLGSITLSSGGAAEIVGTIDNTAANSNLAAPTGGKFTLKGTVLGGTIDENALTQSSGTLDGAIVNGNVTVASPAYLILQNGGGFTGNASVDGAIYLGSNLTFLANSTLNLTGNGSRLDYTNGVRRTATIASSATLLRSGSGYSYLYDDTINSGVLSVTGGTLSAYGNITNQGAVAVSGGATLAHQSGYAFVNSSGATASVTGSGSVLRLYNLSNSGALSASNGGLIQLAGSFSTANLGAIDVSNSGSVELTGVLTNTSANLVAPTGGTYTLTGTIVGGTIADQTITANGGTLDGAVLAGNLTLGSALIMQNGAQVTGITTVNSGGVYLGSDLGLAANATVSLTGSGSRIDYTNGVQRTLTIPVGATVSRSGTGYSYLYDHVVNNGNITVSGGTLYGYGNITNQGNVSVTGGASFLQNTGYAFTNSAGHTATASGNASVLRMYNPSNAGTLAADHGGTLQFAGIFTTGNLGTVDLTNGGFAEITGTLNNASAILTAPTNGTYALTGTIAGGTIAEGAITPNSGALDAATLTGNITIGASQSLTLRNNAQITGNTTVNTGSLYLGSDLTLAPNATVALTGSGSRLDYTSGAVRTLTIPTGASVTRSGSGYSYLYMALQNSGTVSISGGTLYGYSDITNQGTVDVSGGATYSQSSSYKFTNAAGHTASVSGTGSVLTLNNIANAGTLAASNGGVLQLTGAFSTGNIGLVDVTGGGVAELLGVVDNTASGATVSAPTGGSFVFKGTITGGNVTESALTQSSGTLDGAQILGNATLASGQTLTLKNGAGITGKTSITGGSLNLGSDLTLLANSTLALSGSASTLSYSGGTLRTLTIPSTVTLSRSGSGYSYLYDDLVNDGTVSITGGTLYAYSNATNRNAFSISGGGAYVQSSPYTFTNTAGHTVSVSGTGSLLSLNNVTNSGTLSATNGGALVFTGALATTNLGTVDLTGGGTAAIGGTLDNTSATLTAPVNGAYQLAGGTIKNGTIAPGALTFTGSGGTLRAVALTGNVTLPSSSTAVWTNGTTLAANATLSLGNNASIYWQQAGTLVADNLQMGTSSYLYVNGANASLTLDQNTTATGDIQIYTDGSAGTSLINQGSITHTGGTGYFYGNSTINSGTIAVNGGTLYFGWNLTGATAANNAGATLRVNGGALDLQVPTATPLVNNGTIDVKTGTFYTNNRLTNGATGVLQGGGTIQGNVTIAGGTIAPGGSGIGTLTVSGGSIIVTGAATFAVDLGGTTADQLRFQSPGGIVNLGGGLLSLSLNLLNAPTANTTFNLITVSNGSGITGTFAGLANNGDTLTANFAGNPFTFSINYQSNAVALTYTPIAVPEPSTYVLMAGGLLALIGAAKRKRRQ